MTRMLGVGILAACLATPLSVGAQTATIGGVVSTTARAPRPVRVTMDQKVCGSELPDEAIVADAAGRLANAVITIAGLKATTAPPAASVLNEQCRFAPRVQVVRPNAAVSTSSRDAVLHTTNAQTSTGQTLFNVALAFPGMTIQRPVNGPGVVRVGCNIHPWMRAWMIVTDEAAAVSGPDGRFSVTNVPPGTYEVRIWHESLKAAPQKVTVVAGKPVEVSFTLK